MSVDERPGTDAGAPGGPVARAATAFRGGVWTEDQLIADVEAGLGGRGRVLVRPSGTEALVRVMVEAPTQGQAEAGAESIAGAVRAAG